MPGDARRREPTSGRMPSNWARWARAARPPDGNLPGSGTSNDRWNVCSNGARVAPRSPGGGSTRRPSRFPREPEDPSDDRAGDRDGEQQPLRPRPPRRRPRGRRGPRPPPDRRSRVPVPGDQPPGRGRTGRPRPARNRDRAGQRSVGADRGTPCRPRARRRVAPPNAALTTASWPAETDSVRDCKRVGT